MAWWDSWLDWKPWSPWGGNKLWEAKTFEEFEKEYYNWMGVEMPTITTDQDHEVRLKRLELKYEELDGRLKYHSVNHYPTSSDRPGRIFCCEWMRRHCIGGQATPPLEWKYCPKCGRKLYA